MSKTYRNTYGEARAAAVAYYAMCDRAQALGVPTSLDDPSSPKTVRGLRRMVRRAERLAVAA